jgi:hypothetical protein
MKKLLLNHDFQIIFLFSIVCVFATLIMIILVRHLIEWLVDWFLRDKKKVKRKKVSNHFNIY